MAQLRELYKNEVAPALMKKFSYKSPMQIPKLDKIAVSYTHLDVYKRQPPRELRRGENKTMFFVLLARRAVSLGSEFV